MTSRRRPTVRSIPAAVAVALLIVAGCSAVTTPFQKAASDAASTFAAAAQSLTLVHEDKLSPAYADGSFINFIDATEGLEDELPKLGGAPGADVVQRLAALTKRANAAIRDPCLDGSCDWAAQVEALKAARDALDKASKAQ